VKSHFSALEYRRILQIGLLPSNEKLLSIEAWTDAIFHALAQIA